MTISSQARTAGPFACNGSTTVFPFAFKVFSTSDVAVVFRTDVTGVETTLTLGVDYTVSLNTNQDANPGGTVTTIGAFASGTTLTLTSKVAYLQPTDLTNQGGFYPKVITTALDRLTIFAQQILNIANRALRFPISDGNLDGTLPGKDQRKGTVLAFDATTGLPVVGPSIADTGTVGDAVAAIQTVADNIADVNTVADYADEVANFNATYQGPKATDPTTRNDGSPLQAGDLYFNTANDRLRTYTGSRWQEANTGSVAVQQFTGNGSTVDFQLNLAPDSENVVQVFIGGVYQSKTVYDLTGTNGDILTFTSAPPNGAAIEAVTFSVLPLGVVDANQVQMGDGSTLADQQANTKLRSVNCLMFVPTANHAAAVTGSHDVGYAVQAAINAAETLGLPYLEGPGDYWVGSTNFTWPSTRDVTFKGAGRDLTNYLTDLNDGSKVFNISGQWYDVGEFRVLSKSGTKKNFIGVALGDTVADVSGTRSRLRVKVSYAAIGVMARGWVTDLDVFTTYCDQGFKGEELNSCSVKLRGEHNVQGFAIDGAIATTFEQLLEENTFSTGATTVPSYIDNFKGITVNSLYLEGGVFSTNAVIFAPTTQSYGLTLNGVASEIAPADKANPVIIDRVHGVQVAGNVFAGGFNATVGFTANARGIVPLLTAPPATSSGSNSTMRLQDNSKQIRKAQNWSGDRCFNHLVSSFDTVTKTGVTISADTTNVISGKRSLRIDATAAASFPQLELRRTVNRLPRVANLVGKTIKAFAWIYVPSLAKFEDRTYQPGIEIAFGGGASLTSTMQRTMKAGAWNLVETPAITCPGGWTGGSTDRIALRFYVVGNTGTGVDSGYYIVVDSWFLCDGNVSIIDIQRGNFEDINLLGVSTDGDKLRLVSDNFEGATNADSTFAVGDVIDHAAPAPSGFVGKVCTTAGAVGSTAVFKTFGAISA